MSSNKQSPRQSQNPSPAPSQQAPIRSLIASKVASNEDVAKVLRDLSHNYIGVEKVSQVHDKDGKPVGAIRVDFNSEKSVTEILNKGYILIDGKQRPVRAYRSITCHRCHREGHRAPECPQKPLTEQRLMEIFKEQQAQLQHMMNVFESKWNARLSSLTTPANNVNAVEQLLPIVKDLTTTCQQFNQQNVQMQRSLGSVVNRVQDVQTKLINASTIQNGH